MSTDKAEGISLLAIFILDPLRQKSNSRAFCESVTHFCSCY